MRKAQIQSQVLVYVLAVIIMGMILVFGTKSIIDMKSNMCKTELAQFRNKIKSDISTIAQDYGTSKTKTYSLSCGDYREVCFVDMDRGDVLDELNQNGASGIIIDSVQGMLQGGAALKNMYLCPPCTDQEYVGNITLSDAAGGETGYMCFDLAQGRASMRIKGLGNLAQISPIK